MTMTTRHLPAISRRLENTAFCLLLIVVALAPLPFGSNGPESTWLLSGLSGLVLFALALAAMLDPALVSMPRARPLTVALAGFAFFGVWAIVQILPGLPAGLPHPLWSAAAATLHQTARATISIDPEATLSALAKAMGYFAIGISALLLLRDARRRRLAVAVLILAGGLYAAYGLIALAAGDCCVVWQKKTSYFGVATGPFINRNSFATYLGLIALTCLGLLLRGLGELRRISAPTFVRRTALTIGLLVADRWLESVILVAALAALLLTQSRAGVTSLILGALALSCTASYADVFGSRGRRWLPVMGFAAILAAGILAFGGAYVGRIASEGVEDVDRTQSWQIIVTGIEASPWLGHGFGTFPEAFPLYRDDRLDSRRYWDKAQDTYLELALDMGIPATLVLLTGFAALVALCWKGLSRRRRERRIFPAIGIAATVLVGAHSIYDFSMQIPAIASTFAFILGIALTESGIWRASEPSGKREISIVGVPVDRARGDGA
jgi:O-antigen ligase